MERRALVSGSECGNREAGCFVAQRALPLTDHGIAFHLPFSLYWRCQGIVPIAVGEFPAACGAYWRPTDCSDEAIN